MVQEGKKRHAFQTALWFVVVTGMVEVKMLDERLGNPLLGENEIRVDRLTLAAGLIVKIRCTASICQQPHPCGWPCSVL